MLLAAAMDDVDIPWHVDAITGSSSVSLSALIDLMDRCLDSDPNRRPLLDDIQTALQSTS